MCIWNRFSVPHSQYISTKENILSKNHVISTTEFYGDLVYKFKEIIGNTNFSDLFKRIINRFKSAGYTLDIMRQTACLV